MPEELKTEDLTGVEIFAAGTWTDSMGRKQKFTTGDLDKMVDNFKSIGDKVKPFLKLMHLNAEEHKRIAAAPALGWMMNLRRNGIKLVCDFVKVPGKVAALIRAGSYRRISAEIHRKLKDESTGKVYTNVVSAAGLLGAKLPAVPTLADVVKLFDMDENDVVIAEEVTDESWGECYDNNGTPAMAFYNASFDEELETTRKQTGGDSMTDEEKRAMKADITKDVKADFDAKLDEKVQEFSKPVLAALGLDPDGDPVKAIGELKAKNEKATKELSESAKADFEANVDELIDTAKKDGKIVPADENGIRIMVNGWTKSVDDTGKFELEIDDKNTVTGTVVENLKSYFEAMPQKHELKKESGGMNFKGKAGARLPLTVQRQLGQSGVPYAVTGMDMNEEILTFARENKCDFVDAFEAVTGIPKPADPDPSAYMIDEKKEELIRT